MMERKIKVYLDTNIILDWLLPLRQHKQEAEDLLSMIRKGNFDALVSTQSILDAAYTTRKNKMAFNRFRDSLDQMRVFVQLVSIDWIDICWAKEHYTGDFEDDAQYASAYHAYCDFFITRDKALFSLNTDDCPMLVITPEDFMASMKGKTVE